MADGYVCQMPQGLAAGVDGIIELDGNLQKVLRHVGKGQLSQQSQASELQGRAGRRLVPTTGVGAAEVPSFQQSPVPARNQFHLKRLGSLHLEADAVYVPGHVQRAHERGDAVVRTVHSRRVELDDTLVVRPEESGYVEWAEHRLAPDPRNIEADGGVIFAGSAQRDVGKLVLASQVVDQQLDLLLYQVEVAGGVVRASR